MSDGDKTPSTEQSTKSEVDLEFAAKETRVHDVEGGPLGPNASRSAADESTGGVAAKSGTESKSGAASSALGILGFVAALGVGFFLGKQYINNSGPPVEIVEGERVAVDLRGDEPQKGPDDALVTIVEFSDFQCPFCARAAGPLLDAASDYKKDVRVIFKHYPLPGHSKAPAASQAAWAAHQQGKFWEMHDHLYAKKADVGGVGAKAKELGLDTAKFEADMMGDAAKEAIDADFFAGGKVGVGGTPAFFVNGHPYQGAKTEGQWHDIIDAELVAAKQVMDGGVERANVYSKLMEGAASERERPKKRPYKPGDKK